MSGFGSIAKPYVEQPFMGRIVSVHWRRNTRSIGARFRMVGYCSASSDVTLPDGIAPAFIAGSVSVSVTSALGTEAVVTAISEEIVAGHDGVEDPFDLFFVTQVGSDHIEWDAPNGQPSDGLDVGFLSIAGTVNLTASFSGTVKNMSRPFSIVPFGPTHLVDEHVRLVMIVEEPPGTTLLEIDAAAVDVPYATTKPYSMSLTAAL